MLKKVFVLVSLSMLFGLALAQEQDPSDSPPAQAQDAAAQEAPARNAPGGVKTLAGMSILGNEEAPKSLVIVPWKSSELGDGISVNDLIDERARPVDKEVFLREVRYYQLRSGTAE